MRSMRLTARIALPFNLLALIFLGSLTTPAAHAKTPYMQPDDTWIEISGSVESVSRDAFVLDYGDGQITVEMDDGDRDADGYKLSAGDKVKVSGVVDDDLFEQTTIEAGSVYVEKLGTTFYASAFDEEDAMVTISFPVVVSAMSIEGRVIDVREEEFTLNTGEGDLIVEVEDMAYDPLDDIGYQKIEEGDYIKVFGSMDDDFLEGREMVADNIIELTDFDRRTR